MGSVVSPSCLNNNRKLKYLKAKESQTVLSLAEALKADTPVGLALRTLIRRVRYPREPLTGKDLETLLLLGIAEIWAGIEI